MWSSMALLAIPIALDPVRLGLTLLLISRSRPAQNLLVYWIGCFTLGLLLLLVPILVLHFTPMFSAFAHDLGNPATSVSSAVRYLEIGAGVLVLSIAAFIAVRFFVFTRQRTQSPARSAGTSTVVVDSDPPNPILRLASQDGSGSAIRRLLGRANTAWESGSLWVALAIGFFAAPNPSMVIFGLTTIPTSGAAIGVQIGAAIVFVIETLALVELVLVGSLVAPVKTQALLRVLHDWARAYRRQILVAMLALVGLALVAQGIGFI